MIRLPIFQQSPTAQEVSQCLLPLSIATLIAIILSIGIYMLRLAPSQDRLRDTNLTFQRVLNTHNQYKGSWNTQLALQEVWEQMPARKGFTGIGVSISALAKSHNVRIPDMGYDMKKFRHQLATKGTLSFKAAGRYEAIRKFIYELESQWPQLFIEKLTAERAKKGTDVAFSINVSTFLKEKEGKRRGGWAGPHKGISFMTKQNKWVLLGGLVVLWIIMIFTQFSEDSLPPGASSQRRQFASFPSSPNSFIGFSDS